MPSQYEFESSRDYFPRPSIRHWRMLWKGVHVINSYTLLAERLNLHGHFTHEPSAVTLKLWEPKRKCPKAVPRHLQIHAMWSRTLKCEVICDWALNQMLFNERLFMRVLTCDKLKVMNVGNAMMSQWFCVRPTSKRWLLKIIQVTMCRCHVEIHVDFTPTLHSHTPLVPQA